MGFVSSHFTRRILIGEHFDERRDSHGTEFKVTYLHVMQPFRDLGADSPALARFPSMLIDHNGGYLFTIDLQVEWKVPRVQSMSFKAIFSAAVLPEWPAGNLCI